MGRKALRARPRARTHQRGAAQVRRSTRLQLPAVFGPAEIFALPAKRLAFGRITSTGELGETLSAQYSFGYLLVALRQRSLLCGACRHS